MDKDEVKLLVNGVEFGGWKEVEIVAGIERLARDFTLGVTSKWPGTMDIPRRIKPGDLCEVSVGDDKLLTGYVDATPIRYDGKSTSVSVKGRSKTADLVDCSAIYKTGQWKNSRVEKIAADLVAPFKTIEVITEASTGDPKSQHQINPGESVFECIDRLLSARQLLCTDDALGRMVFIKTGSGGRAATALEFGKNILSADSSLDAKDMFNQYLVHGQHAGSDMYYGDAACSAKASVSDSSVMRYRPLKISQFGNVTTRICADRALFEKMHRAAKALETVYTVQGWRQADGSLWLPNQLVRMVDPVIGFDGEFLIVEVALRKNDSGTTATIKVGLESGYIPLPEAKTKAASNNWSDAQPIR